MKKLAAVLVVSALCSSIFLPACVDRDPQTQPEVSTAEALVADPGLLVGTYKFVYTDTRRAAVEADLKNDAKSPEALREAIAAAETEANASEIEFSKDGVFHSRIEGKEIMSSPYTAKGASGSTLVLTMTNGKGEAKTTTVRFQDADTIVIQDPKKGELTFRRASSRG